MEYESPFISAIDTYAYLGQMTKVRMPEVTCKMFPSLDMGPKISKPVLFGSFYFFSNKCP
jgi:hypothetical protein